MRPWGGTRIVRAAVVLCAALAACTGGNGGDEPSPGPTAAGTPGPTVTIVEPRDGAIVGTGSVTVRVEVTGFQVGEGSETAPGTGRIVFYLDVREIPSTKGQPAAVEGKSETKATLTHTWNNVKAGPHSLAVQLVNADGTPLESPVVAAVTITAR